VDIKIKYIDFINQLINDGLLFVNTEIINTLNKFVDKLEQVEFDDITIDGVSLKEYFGLLSFEYYKYIRKHEPNYTKYEYIIYLLSVFNETDYNLYLFKSIIKRKEM